ncbi:Tetratricopeptide repeat-containing protein [Tangfeifania diversioriginum]|uniref:Tetratricopeptide repeat-containing protein n=1 Tax=Tangfeifania diversioriginum TaxID=1168035 RepID=A0A1M6HYX9_9BACT|nr:tetratricopeptide repeat protein [Tangfeifania diversioriginum]SHJ27418.1 Tetratricopeptide repeat-containing protein [Tangfeifania diversioriginum]
MIRTILFIPLLLISVVVFGQNERKFVRSGNQLYEEALKDTLQLDTTKFSQAEEEYRKALNKRPGHEKWEFNLADAMYKQMRFDEAQRKFSELSEKLETPEEQARALHNLGNSQLMQEKIDESIESYKKALRKKPDDIETKYNLAFAQMLKNQQEQQQNQDQNQDQQQDQNQQQQQQDQNNQNQQQNQDQQKNQQNQQNQQNQDQNQQQQQQQQQNKISRQDAEQLLQALQNDERDIQEKVKKEKAAKARKSNVEKEW